MLNHYYGLLLCTFKSPNTGLGGRGSLTKKLPTRLKTYFFKLPTSACLFLPLFFPSLNFDKWIKRGKRILFIGLLAKLKSTNQSSKNTIVLK